MLLGAKVALFRDDLKGLLAYSTISHLGLITFLLGLGTKTAAVAAVFHILCHASFKAALFMLVGIIEHATKTRSINALGGLRGKMPLTFGLTLVAALSMAGLPPLNGFLSKELMLIEAAQVVWAGSDLLVPVLTALAAMFSVAYSLRLISRTFLGPTRTDYPKMPQDPPIGLWAAPAILVGLVVTIGIWPMGLTAWIVLAAGQAVVGQAVVVDITLWHGLGAASLWMSVAALGGGIALGGSFNIANKALTHLWNRVPRPDAKAIFDITLGGVIAGCRGVMVRLDDGAITRFIAIAITAIVGTSLYAFATGSHLPGTRIPMPMGFVPIVCWLVLGVALGAAVIKHRDRLFALLMVSVIGLILSLGFAYLSAPDLALTQITVEVVTVILMLLALQFLPKTSSDKTPALRRMRDAVIACVAGLALGALAYSLMMRDAAFSMISRFHLDNSKSGAGGNNAVNTIIVDFRGFDTYGEIIVLGIAALVVFALVDALLRAGPAKAPRNARNLASQSGERHPVMLGVATRFLLPVMLLVGAHLFLRGHNLPGGGFVAGLVFAIAIVLQYVGSGYAWTEQRHRINEHTLIAAGVMIATATGVGSWLVDRPFLTSHFTYIQLPALAPFEVATATLFDLGVFLCVLGAVLLTLSSLARLGLPRTDPTQTKSGDR
jgi:multicomponent K+:H+ antiporter subunit A